VPSRIRPNGFGLRGCSFRTAQAPKPKFDYSGSRLTR